MEAEGKGLAHPETPTKVATEPKEPRGWLLYDEECGVCHQVVPRFEKTLRKRGFAIAPLQSERVRRRLGFPQNDMVSIRLLLRDGRQIVGADVYRYVMKRMWWSYPVYVLSVAPLLRQAFDWSYRTFAANRYWVSKACGLPGAGEEESAASGRRETGTQ